MTDTWGLRDIKGMANISVDDVFSPDYAYSLDCDYSYDGYPAE